MKHNFIAQILQLEDGAKHGLLGSYNRDRVYYAPDRAEINGRNSVFLHFTIKYYATGYYRLL